MQKTTNENSQHSNNNFHSRELFWCKGILFFYRSAWSNKNYLPIDSLLDSSNRYSIVRTNWRIHIIYPPNIHHIYFWRFSKHTANHAQNGRNNQQRRLWLHLVEYYWLGYSSYATTTWRNELVHVVYTSGCAFVCVCECVHMQNWIPFNKIRLLFNFAYNLFLFHYSANNKTSRIWKTN